MHIIKYMDSAMSCAKMAEPIILQFGMLSRVGSANMYYIGCRCPHRKGHFWGIWLIEKHCKTLDFEGS